MRLGLPLCVLIGCGSEHPIIEPVEPDPQADSSSFELLDGTVAPDWTSPSRTPPDGGDPPIIACGQDAGHDDAGECPLPTSVCAGPEWLVYYSNGTCVDGTCRYDKHFRWCDVGCAKGACLIQHFTAPSP